ncbi:MAG TPA: hypothetical protein VHD91_04730 [Gaiellaceae bacterium]|nr:hypothetical protein [Gaiellaceae bacterium]
MNRWRKDSDLKRLFSKVEPQVPEGLVERLTARAARPSTTRWAMRRVALAGGLSVVLLTALAAVGGISYAGTLAKDIVTGQTVHRIVFGSRLSQKEQVSALPQAHNAALDQYGQSGNETTQAVKPDQTQTVSAGTSSVAITPDAASAIVAAAPGALIHVDPTPPNQAGNLAAVSIVVTNAQGTIIPITLSGDQKPLAVTLAASTGDGAIPCVDSGNGCAAAPELTDAAKAKVAAGTLTCSDLDSTTRDGYYEPDASHVVIFTCHLTVFAVVTKDKLSISASGRKFAPAGSGKFGDPTLYSPQPAQLKQVGSSVTVGSLKSLSGHSVSFGFFVNEQVAAYITVFAKGKKLPIALKGTMIRGTTLTNKVDVKALHIPVLKPGTLKLRLRIPDGRLQPGEHYRIRILAIDYDGNKTYGFIPFTG